ncbi:transposase [Lacrimispora amygdalina]|uniref:Transposase n=1 Tax=Lacrimispora amygdalina TaxID=253257 RepID=A0A3E2NBA0_9FIRM|nr:transposase [Clostridium indicum]
MVRLLKSYKTEIKPTLEQIQMINKTIGTCRFVYNFFLAHNKEVYEKEKKFVSGMDFSKWLNNIYIKENPEYSWIKEVSSKSVKQSIMNADRAFKRFFKGQSRFPNFKKKGKSDVKMYFVKTDAKVIIPCERHRIKIPTIGWVRIKEKGYIPTNPSTHIIKSGTVSCKAGRYYVSVLIEEQENPQSELNDFGIGIDLGVKDFAITSNGITKKNINKSSRLKKLEKQLKREQRCLSRKYEDYKKRSKKGEATRQNIQKQIAKVQKLHQRINTIRTDYINKSVNEIVKTKPSYITIEDLNVSGMMKNRHLSKAVASQKFYEFRTKLEAKCKETGIELRVVDRWYPSSKLCHECGCIKKDLKLSDREYICECGYRADRDYNASLNLRDAITYKIA